MSAYKEMRIQVRMVTILKGIFMNEDCYIPAQNFDRTAGDDGRHSQNSEPSWQQSKADATLPGSRFSVT